MNKYRSLVLTCWSTARGFTLQEMYADLKRTEYTVSNVSELIETIPVGDLSGQSHQKAQAVIDNLARIHAEKLSFDRRQEPPGNLPASQRQLLLTLVQADAAAQKERRDPFLVTDTTQGTRIMHNGLEDGQIFCGRADLDALHAEGFVALRAESEVFSLVLLSRARDYVDRSRMRPAESEAAVSEFYVRYVGGDEFVVRHPLASAAWETANADLWAEDAPARASAIGLRCREALMCFVDASYEGTTPAKNTVARLKELLDGRDLGKREQAAAEALVHYWGTVSDLTQKITHSGEPSTPSANWEDLRALVFQTLVVMVELDHKLESS